MTHAHWTTTSYTVTPFYQVAAPTMRYAPVTVPVQLAESYQDGKRWYREHDVLYPSITTVLSATDQEGNKALREWRRRIGETEAQHIATTAARYGTNWHNFCEAFVTNRPVWSYLTTPTHHAIAATLTTVLNAQINTVFLSESQVVSRKYGIAGRMDICAELTDGRRAVIDFKTGKKPKEGNRLQNYGIQAAFYAEAVTELVDRGVVDTIVIVQICPSVVLWQESSVAPWIPLLSERITMFAESINHQLT